MGIEHLLLPKLAHIPGQVIIRKVGSFFYDDRASLTSCSSSLVS